MTMTRQHFALIADIVKELPSLYMDEPISAKQRVEIARYFASFLHATNPNFNRARFLRACGVEE